MVLSTLPLSRGLHGIQMKFYDNLPAAPPKIDGLANEKLVPLLNENEGALMTAGSLLLVLKLNVANCEGFGESAVVSAFGVAFPAHVFVNELNENVELVTDDEDVVVSFDKLLLGT